MTDPATQYAQDVVAGDLVTGKLVRLACERHLRDLEREDIEWRPEIGKRYEDFASHLRHFQGRWGRAGGGRGESVELMPWQQFCDYSLLCWYRENEDGVMVRRYRTSYRQVARKNGKTTSLTVLGAYLFYADGEPGAEVYSVATKLDQARIIHNVGRTMIGRCGILKPYVRILKYNISCPSTASKFEPLGSDSKTLDGLNPHAALVDEYHAHPTSELVNVLKTGMGARDQPALIIITTAGESLDSPCGRERDYAIKVLEGAHEDDTYFSYVAEPDEVDDFTDESCWAKGNPSLGVTVRMQELREEFNQASQDPAKFSDFLRKRLNIWTEQTSSWIPFEKMDAWWKTCRGPLPLERLVGRPCHGGLDLSTTIDLTAFALVWPPHSDDKLWSVLLRLWCPEIGLVDRVRRDRVPYDAWQRSGWITATPGDRVDYRRVKTDILDLAQRFKPASIGYDPWNAEQLTQELSDEGLKLYEVQQSYKNLSHPTKVLEGLIRNCELRHDDNQSLRWQIGNVVLSFDDAGNVRPSKKRATERIDGAIAMIMGLSRALSADQPKRSRFHDPNARLVIAGDS